MSNKLTVNNLVVNELTQAGNINVGGILTATSPLINTAEETATSSSTGAIQVRNGGMGVQGNSYFANNITVKDTVNGTNIVANYLQNAYVTETDNNTWLGTNALNNYAALTVTGGTVSNVTENTAVGYNALQSAQTTGGFDSIRNTAVGTDALSSATSGRFNTATGAGALSGLIHGSGNTSIGKNAGSLQQYGDNNTFIGNGTNVNIATNIYSSSTALGYNARITGNNQVVLGTASETVFVPGVLVVGGQQVTSDRRLKEDIRPIDIPCLEIIQQLQPSLFAWKQTGQADVGFIAQDVNQTLRDAGLIFSPSITTQEGFETMDYNKVVVLLTKAVQELQQQVHVLTHARRVQETVAFHE